MRMSKAMMEKVMVVKSRNRSTEETLLSGTRYGNVMASCGSVIPLFTELIKNGLPITIKDSCMTRFMLSLPDAVELVLFTFDNGKEGDLFIQKAPTATILTVLEALKKIFNSNNEIRIIGTRHGEKKHEVPLSKKEFFNSEDMGNYYRVKADTRDLNYAKYFEEGNQSLSQIDDYTTKNTIRLNVDEMVSLLFKLEFIKNVLKN